MDKNDKIVNKMFEMLDEYTDIIVLQKNHSIKQESITDNLWKKYFFNDDEILLLLKLNFNFDFSDYGNDFNMVKIFKPEIFVTIKNYTNANDTVNKLISKKKKII